MRMHFRLRWVPLVATVVVCAIGISLGNWQMRRAEEKLVLQQQLIGRAGFDPLNASALKSGELAGFDPLNASALKSGELPDEFRRVTAEGEFVREWGVYLDNRPLRGKSGFYLLMPMKLVDSPQSVLVLRGWFPRDARDPTRLPEIPFPPSPVHLEGKVRHSAGKLMQLGEPGELGPGTIVQNAEVADFIRASKLPLHTFIIEQTSDTTCKQVTAFHPPR
ncbi:MAG: SURF1 family protein [Oxalobacteraceae bacterium]|nr:SURF1 family protein [Oxalobacteraceae bacterium]